MAGHTPVTLLPYLPPRQPPIVGDVRWHQRVQSHGSERVFRNEFSFLGRAGAAARAGFDGADCRDIDRFDRVRPAACACPRSAQGGSKGCAQGRSEGRSGTGRPGPRRGRSGGPGPAAARRTAGSADLRALDQVLPQGPGRQRQADLLHRQGWPHRIRPAGGGRRDHRAGRRAEEDPARDPAARHAAGARHPGHHRQQRPGTEPVRDLLPERLHVRLRSHPGNDRQSEEGPEPDRPGDQFQRRAADAAVAAGRIRQGL